jgi:Tfp pilus assembly protein FimV
MLDPAPPDALQSTAPAPEVVASASADASPAVTLALAAPTGEVGVQRRVDQPKTAHGTIDAAVGLAAHPLASDAVDSAAPLAAPRAASTSMATRARVALIALGLILLVGSPLVTRWRNQSGALTPQE